MNEIESILEKADLNKEDLIALLSAEDHESSTIFKKAAEIKKLHVGNKVYFRGLIEYSNHCSKNCLYCGIRSGNSNISRYEMSDDEVLDAARYAWTNRYASIVIQAGERADEKFIYGDTRIKVVRLLMTP